jgi:hypothetical protein
MKKTLLTLARVLLSIVFTILLFLIIGLIGVILEKLKQLPIGVSLMIVLSFSIFTFLSVMFYKGIKEDLF